MDEEISKALNIEPYNPITPAIIPDVPVDENEDFAYARENLYIASEAATSALQELVEIAKSSQHPRAFEVLATLAKTVADIQGQLLDNQAKKKSLQQTENPDSSGGNVTHNNLVVTTADLQALIKQMGKSEDE